MSCAVAQPGFRLPPPIPEPRILPRELREFRDYHAGETIVVCGCGSSLSQLVSPERFVTIGVNDVGRLFQPDYLVVLNPRQQFRGDRFRFVEESRAQAIFTQLELGIRHPHIVRFRLGKFGGVDFSDVNSLHYTRNSPYLAVCLAVCMGATRIGLIGVDFTDDHFFAHTGQHPLMREFAQIDREYKALHDSCARNGIELVNLSQQSRLTALPKITPQQFARTGATQQGTSCEGRKIFFVNNKFLSCGDVFRDGLSHAADDLNARHEEAYWDDPALAEKVRQFSPDLLFVVHGRRFAQRWKNTFKGFPSAVWLLDEPYEVDDTARFSGLFETVLVNDPTTLHRHRNAHYLPVCYDPALYFYHPDVSRKHAVGFIGGYNPLREEILEALALRGLLSYVVGGPWRKPAVQALSLSNNIPAEQTAELYRDTKIILNVFRTEHHFNRQSLPATSLNPRIYEGAACGALVISEDRPEVGQVCSSLPVFSGAEELASLVEELLRDPAQYEVLRKACIRQLARHTYAQRLYAALKVIFGKETSVMSTTAPAPESAPAETSQRSSNLALSPLGYGWEKSGDIAQFSDDGIITLGKPHDHGPGTEQGLVSKDSFGNVDLSFHLRLEPASSFVAKLHLQNPKDHCTNSYHMCCDGQQAYFARHNYVFRAFGLGALQEWVRVQISYHDGLTAIRINDVVVCAVRDQTLSQGFCFLGTKGGTVRVRNVEMIGVGQGLRASIPPSSPAHTVLYRKGGGVPPVVSIVTTVYDRVSCLERCLRSVNALRYDSFEHIVVADSPPVAVVEQLRSLTETYDQGRGRRIFANAQNRANDWGISPARIGLALATGRYVCFLSDDNGYLPDHFEPLVEALEADPSVGFAYSSCLYNGTLTLNCSPPKPGRIDLGQPLFRRALFDMHLGGSLPFRELAWDWRMIEHFMRKGVHWQHIDRPTFIFRAAKYPQFQVTGP